MVGTQLGNFGCRLEQLHRGSEGQAGASMNLTLDGSAFMPLDEGRQSLGELGQILGRDAGDQGNLADREQLNRMVWGDQTGTTDGLPNDRLNAGPQAGADSAAPSGPRIWNGGAISLGERDATTQTAKMAITTSGISVGVDMSLADNLGVGVGFGQEKTDVGTDSSRMEAASRMAVAYGSWRPSDDVFIDGILGYGDLGFDMRRRTPVNSSLVFGRRDGSAVFGSLSAGVDRVAGPSRWISYGRVEVLNADLDAYVETGSPLWALSYEARSVESLQAALGLRYEREILRGQDRWTPGIRVEWTHEFGDAGAQVLRYADWLDWLDGPGYAIGQEGWERSRFNLGLSLGWRAGDGWIWTGEYDGAFSNGEFMNGLRIKGARAF
ncbi:autotransporter outer membrane beta-barrel domain-containing protein [Brevundimonas sp.]|uniref:autotransporter outer membrane beta-barrel domain-containing protein n=1 Tax=Brevundimonas sp. TaxID=1871086 RepID=UPI00248A17DD|nr:autotransporter outer membrane beta-barrel domain-containing protein [Brevundimonas sp.]MDI1280691.1 autotransporter outer membrane beta-barrel domain-containing protein [Brevundimonas sp.]